MALAIGDARTKHCCGLLVGVDEDAIDGLLPLSELTTDRHGGGAVTRVVHGILGTCIEQEHIALVQLVDVAVVVERLTMIGADGREREEIAQTLAYLAHSGCDVLFVHTRLHEADGGLVHRHGDIDSLGQLLEFLSTLVVAHIDNVVAEFEAGRGHRHSLEEGVAGFGADFGAEQLLEP